MREQIIKKRRSKSITQKLNPETKEILLYRLRKRKYINIILFLLNIIAAVHVANFIPQWYHYTPSRGDSQISHLSMAMFVIACGYIFSSIFFIVGNIYEIKTIKKIVYEVKLILVHYGTVNYVNFYQPYPVVFIDRLRYTATLKAARKVKAGMYVEYKYASLEPINFGCFLFRKPKIFISLKEIK